MRHSSTLTVSRPPAETDRSARRLASASYWMVAVFAAWTIVFVVASGPVAELFGQATEAGEVVYLDAWLPWLAVTLLWVLPLVAGVVLAVLATTRRVGGYAWGALVVNAAILFLMVGPPLLDRILHL